jgi:hypothetical protein
LDRGPAAGRGARKMYLLYVCKIVILNLSLAAFDLNEQSVGIWRVQEEHG